MSNDSEYVVHQRTRCQYGRALPQDNHRIDKCPDRTVAGSMWCARHKAEAFARVRQAAKT